MVPFGGVHGHCWLVVLQASVIRGVAAFMVIQPEPMVSTAPDEEISASETVIEGRSLGRIAWTRLKRDKVAMAGGIFVILLILMAILAPLIVKLLGHPPNLYNQDPKLLDPNTGNMPRGSFGGVSGDHLFGLE